MSLLSALSRNPKPSPVPGDLVQDVDIENFVQEVIEASRDKVIVVDFWAPWCGPCKELGPLLEKVVRAHKGSVRLAKIDIDKNPEIAQQMRIQSIPAVFAFFRGQPVDGFMGAQPESQMKAWLDKVLKTAGAAAGVASDSGAETAVSDGSKLLAEGDALGALTLFQSVITAEPSNIPAFAGLLRAMVALGDHAKAQELLNKAPLEMAKDKELLSVKTAIELAEQTSNVGSPAELEAKLLSDPNDHQSRFDLAMALYAKGQKEAAVDQLLEIVRKSRTWNEDAARKQLVKFFEAFGLMDPLTISARKRLSSIMYS